jgi:hypothetical protein
MAQVLVFRNLFTDWQTIPGLDEPVIEGVIEGTVGTPEPHLVIRIGLGGPAEGTLPDIQEQSEPINITLLGLRVEPSLNGDGL